MTIRIYCDICHNFFLTIESSVFSIENIKRAYGDHKRSDECRKVAIPVSRVELDPF